MSRADTRTRKKKPGSSRVHKLISLPNIPKNAPIKGIKFSGGQKVYTCLCRGPLWITTDPSKSFANHLREMKGLPLLTDEEE